jgi:predicted nucleic acid-binding protein
VSAVFVDTNVILYSVDSSEPEKQPVARSWLRALWQARAGRLSVQILQEFYANVTRLKSGLDQIEARAAVETLGSWNPLTIDPSLLNAAWDIEDRFGFAFWDSLIVAAAHRTGCTHLLTEDLQDGQIVDGLTIVDPFLHSPDSVLPQV